MSDRYYGLYRGTCEDNQDPENLNRIRLRVPQVLHTNVSNWASPCLPVVTNADHPDHLPHLASEVAALLNTHTTHTATLTSGSGGTPSHTHSVSISLSHNAHSGNSGELTHAHEDSEDPLEVNGTEHTPHRKVPNLKQGVWVMFEGGDPNFPVWIGVQ